MNFLDPAFIAAFIAIVGFDIILSGDNAVVIAMATRNLKGKERTRAVLWGSAAAIIMRVIFTLFAVKLLGFPYLKIVGAVLLLWIGIKLMVPDDGEEEIAGQSGLFAAIKTILIADLVMSIDNVVAVAAAADAAPEQYKVLLLFLGLAISIPLIIFSSAILLKLMDRYPVIVVIGAALLGIVAGQMLVSDPVTVGWVKQNAPWLRYAVPIVGAIFVVGLGKYLAKRAELVAPKAP